MGKSSCFKIITCGSNSVDHDDVQAPTPGGKSPSGRGWSFRKRSARHRILSNTVVSESPSSVNKESPESTVANLTVSDKTSVIQWKEEKPELSSQLDSKVSKDLTTRKDDCRVDAAIDESDIIVMQSAIRGLLAQRLLLKQKKVIKLQAAVRGHLVRKHAIGTLRCVQAIVKMQALVRERRARLVEGSGNFENHCESNENSNHDTEILNKRRTKPNGTFTYISIEKLLSNKFARQLMESTPRNEPINIKCDPAKSDSAWKWLQRWMSASSPSNEEESGSSVVQHKKEKLELFELGGEPSDSYSESTNLKTGGSENDDNFSSISVVPESTNPKLQDIDESNSTHDITESALPETIGPERVSLAPELKELPDKDETEIEQEVPDLRIFSTEQPETEVKQLSRKASNPSFNAAQSKFEQLSSCGTSKKLTTSYNLDREIESSSDHVSLELRSADNPISNAPALQIGGSECGTELSISSTLDSPDRSEIELNDIKQDLKISSVTDHPSQENIELEVNERNESVNAATGESVNSIDLQEVKIQEADPTDPYLELESEKTHLVDQLSPDASPRSHITVPESQTTPSSQVSVKPKKSRGEKSRSNKKNKYLSADRTPNQDSGSRNSLEKKEHKNGKRRNSFGLVKPDHHLDQEPRESSSSITVPSYMQATESARAKAIANGSPRSSPDVHEKDVYIKKRQSLPGANGRQGSPRIERSLSQAQQNVKGNGTGSPQDRKWRR